MTSPVTSPAPPSVPPSMTSSVPGIEVDRGPDRALLTVRGDVDEREAAALADAALRCLDAGVAVVQVDLAAVTFLGSAGVNALVRVHRAAAARAAVLRLRHVPRAVVRVLSITGLDAVLAVDPVPGGSVVTGGGLVTP